MKKFFTDDEILEKAKILALVCLGGMAEGFDYQNAKRRLNQWGQIRKKFRYSGGVVEIDSVGNPVSDPAE